MSRITQLSAVGPIELFQTSTDLASDTYAGQKFYSSDGRQFTLVQNGTTALVAAHLISGPADVANHTGLVVVSFTAAAPAQNASAPYNPPAQTTNPASVVVTLGGTAVCANEYAGGYADVASGTGIGQRLKIASNTVQATTTGNTTIVLEDSPLVALDVTSTVNLIKNPYGSNNGGTPTVPNVSTNGVLVASATAASRGQLIGIALYPIAASTSSVAIYGLVQNAGPVAGLSQGGSTKGLDLMPSASVAGALATYVVATSSRVGTATQTATDGKASAITIQL